MKEEIAAAVFFVARLVKRHGSLDSERRDRFSAALTSALFEKYKNHWYPQTPLKGQGYRCLRMNRCQRRDPLLEGACIRSSVPYEGLGLPLEITVWVDPGEVSCRYGEHSIPFCVTKLQGCRRGDREFSRRINEAVERANSDVQSGSSSDEEGADTNTSSSSCSSQSALCPPLVSAPFLNLEPKTIPTVSNPNSVYQSQFSEFASIPPPPAWSSYPKRKAFSGDSYAPHCAPSGGPFPQQPLSQFHPHKDFKPYRASFSFTGPRQDKYHWVSKNRS